ncbi:transposase [Kitasatospora sp. NPDC056531]|uniref:helix-turn-helix domain-containing protein n=1 Tax=Kitasatospora sp. NPDC056531 TaxID=3345856 RepID=UPI0036998973
MQAAEMFEQDVKPPEVARRLRVSPKSAYQWHQLWCEGGVQALASRGPSGSRCRLSPRCLEKLAAYLEQGPAAHGWVEDQVWTAARVATLIGRKFHVSYSVSGATRLMHRLAVTVDPCGECVKAGKVVSPDGIEPLRQPFALTLGEHLAEGADVAGEGVQFRAVDQDGLEPKVLRLGEGLRPAENPSSHDTG